jgi:hypothetical protein
MQYIKTRYLCPTNQKGSRIKATASNGESLTIPYDYSMNEEPLHAKAALSLAARLGWAGHTFASGRDDNGHIFVPVTYANTHKLEAVCA